VKAEAWSLVEAVDSLTKFLGVGPWFGDVHLLCVWLCVRACVRANIC
jgi:3-methyladenine DNA glycosylase/8-oxoguanine DNA glycosylase